MSHKLLFGRVMRLTEKAVLFEVEENGSPREHWIPKSQIEEGDSVSMGDTEIEVTEWFADKME